LNLLQKASNGLSRIDLAEDRENWWVNFSTSLQLLAFRGVS